MRGVQSLAAQGMPRQGTGGLPRGTLDLGADFYRVPWPIASLCRGEGRSSPRSTHPSQTHTTRQNRHESPLNYRATTKVELVMNSWESLSLWPHTSLFRLIRPERPLAKPTTTSSAASRSVVPKLGPPRAFGSRHAAAVATHRRPATPSLVSQRSTPCGVVGVGGCLSTRFALTCCCACFNVFFLNTVQINVPHQFEPCNYNSPKFCSVLPAWSFIPRLAHEGGGRTIRSTAPQQ